jgi:hypothetical protein
MCLTSRRPDERRKEMSMRLADKVAIVTGGGTGTVLTVDDGIMAQ